MLLLMSMSLSLSLMFMFTKHPLSMGFTLLLQSVIVSMITGVLNYNFWYSYILFLIMVGGMLVLFIYMTSIASNEKFKNSNMMMMTQLMIIPTAFMLYLMYDKYNLYINLNNSDLFMEMNNSMWTLSLTKFLNYPSNMILFMIIMYLFITLIAIVKITDSTYGALRQKI
uniref:NADH-ubiquinone oxidoreductase chain 6 n=1 Tax=Perotis lugubris TaxID=1205687 RepID=A0A0S2MP93_9COLE|nr:NADH deshydrogenase subunit 6 [Perotis lugubris]